MARKFCFYFPPLPKVSGGMQVIADLAEHLHDQAFDTALVVQNPPQAISDWLEAYHPTLPVLQFQDFTPQAEDWWIVPEGWPLALRPGLAVQRCRCIVYVQNWAYLHGHLPQGVHWQNLPVQFWAVSAPVAQFIQQTIGRAAVIVPPAIDAAVFHPVPPAPVAKPAIAWMPRKNRGLGQQIRHIFEAILHKNRQPLPIWLEIDGKTREQVAETLQSASIFLATGFPEGCPLPPLEAMACGCLVCGFAGFGGWDYMRQAAPQGFMPNMPLPPRIWGPNGFFCADADVFGAAMALTQTISAAASPAGAVIRANARQTAAFYSPEAQREALLAAIAG